MFIFFGSCYTNQKISRYNHIYRTIEANWYFSGVEENSDGKSGWDKGNMKQDQENRLLESVCVQHEIDHLMGKTIHNREVKLEPTKVEKKVGRNDPCPCGSGKKHKKCCL